MSNSIIYCGANKNCLETVKKLLGTGADINQINEDGHSLLYVSVFFGRLEVVKLLLQAGANSSQICKYGKSPMDVGAMLGWHEITRVLQRWPAAVPLHVLCLRAIHYSPKKPDVPEWFPPPLLEWPAIEEYLLPDNETREKKRKRDE